MEWVESALSGQLAAGVVSPPHARTPRLQFSVRGSSSSYLSGSPTVCEHVADVLLAKSLMCTTPLHRRPGSSVLIAVTDILDRQTVKKHSTTLVSEARS